MNQHELFDVTIIGGGPAGMYAAFYSGLRKMKTKVIEYQMELGGKLHVYPEKMIWDIGGMTPRPGAQVIQQIVKQGLTFSPTVVLGRKADKIEKNSEGHFIVNTSDGQQHISKTVIVATGSGILRPQKINLEGAERFEISNLHYTVKALKQFKDRTVVISGGGNTALDWANELASVAKKVYIIYRKETMSGHEAQIEQLQENNVICYSQSVISKLLAADNHHTIEQVEITHVISGEVSVISTDDVLINHGYEQDMSLIKNSEVDVDLVNDFYISGTSTSQTSLPGLFAAGDILMHDGKLQLITGAFQDAANAVNSAKKFIEPTAEKAGMVSSHNDLFKEKNRALIQALVTN